MKVDPFEQAAGFLPAELRKTVLGLERQRQKRAEEIRLRVGYLPQIVLESETYSPPTGSAVTPDDLHTVMEIASDHSVHTALDRMRSGFITVRGGHRIGICGEAIVERGKIMGFRRPTSLNIRIAHEVKSAAQDLIPRLKEGDRLPNTLIIAPPGRGKTTLLRDLVRRLSSGEGIKSQRVGVVDERGELAAIWNGTPQMDLGAQTDILDGVPKADGMLLLLRSMNPQILAVDEITHPDDIRAVELAAGCGVTILAAIHGRDQKEILMRPVCRELARQNIFRRALVGEQDAAGERRWKVEEIEC